jgi:hypothetical protein
MHRTDVDGTRKEAKEMYHCMEFDFYPIRQRNEELRREVSTHRLEKQLRQNHKVRGSRLAAFVLRLKSASILFAGQESQGLAHRQMIRRR